ncbi:hypothetical protein Theam_0401 [Thermovibrio ammonificans HB-1]|uniref:Uncharacterized protein n=1 Tax=Thermovibrio ammonificans (strain DSM 15698 / JCM 12110 / HB-1) TaxID=648996 RepID=E8T4W2_THEA1|nr:hypothetical protein [Thermovibrio ammonificans]ADU96374.1 hypothetical protein Theam_0401 [Thermovibrio ammonificans HB-1]
MRDSFNYLKELLRTNRLGDLCPDVQEGAINLLRVQEEGDTSKLRNAVSQLHGEGSRKRKMLKLVDELKNNPQKFENIREEIAHELVEIMFDRFSRAEKLRAEIQELLRRE